MSFFESIRINNTEEVDVKHLFYYQIARHSLEDAKKVSEKNTENDSIPHLSNSIEIQQQLHVSVLFFYLTIESYINFYAVKNDIKNREELEKKPTKEKWKKYPKLKTEKPLTTTYIELLNGNLERLKEKRNSLIHHKPRLIGSEPDFAFLSISIEECEEYYQAIKDLMHELKKIDADASIDWINK